MAQYVRVPAGAGRRIVRRVSPFAFKQDRSAQQPNDKSQAYAGVEARKEAREEELERAREAKEGRT